MTAVSAAPGRGAGLPAAGFAVAMGWLSLVVLVPLAAVVAEAFGGGWSGFWQAVTARDALATIRLTVALALAVAAANAVMGTLVAWVLVRDHFPGQRLVEALIDLPFALPTIVAGLVLNALYGPHSPVGLTWYATRPGVLVALLFVTLPFVIRAVQPTLLSLDRDAEDAAATLGAGRLTAFRRVVLPALVPAVAGGAALAFGRAMGEYGAVVLISGGLARTQVASQYVYQQIESGYLADAAAVATVLLAISVAVMGLLGLARRRAVRGG